MLRYTLDTNCVIALDDERPEAVGLHRLLQRMYSGKAAIQIAAIAAAERQKSGRPPINNYSEFQTRINRLGLGSAKVLPPPAYLGLAFLDYCLLHGDESLALEKEIHEILFSTVPFEFDGRSAVGSRDWQRWLNAKCDVLTMWCHLYHGGDVFVSSDGNFHASSKKSRLLNMGAGQIKRPNEL